MSRTIFALVVACALAAAAASASVHAASAASAASDAGEARLRATLDAVEKAVAYMGRHSRAANLDGGIGVRSVEGQFGALLARYWTRLPLWAVTRLKAIQVLAGKVAKETRESVRRSTPAYYATSSDAGQLLSDHSWDTFFPSRQLSPNSVAALLKEAAAAADSGASDGDDDFDEEFSDNCIREFHGYDGRPPCSISKSCWDTMVMSEGRKDYFLTHQLFYLLTGINANCLHNLTLMARKTGSERLHPLRALFDKFCGRILVAAEMLESRGLSAADRDLFMEQIGLCGLAGYTEFAQSRWWAPVIGWQRGNGCYGVFPGERVAPENFDPARYGNFKRKRSEAVMSDSGCLSHRTSVAMDALVAFVRQLVEAESARQSGGDGIV